MPFGQPMSRRFLLILFFWLAAFGIALAFDQPIATFVRDHDWAKQKAWPRYAKRVAETIKAPGEYWFTITVAIAAFALFARSSRGKGVQAAALIAMAGAISGTNGLVKWMAGRFRPVNERGIRPFDFDPFVQGLTGLIRPPKDLCFPSGHACLAFATAGALAILLPRSRWVFYALAAAIAVERVLENAHYLSDVVAAAALGLLSAKAAHAIVQRMADRPGRDTARASRENALSLRHTPVFEGAPEDPDKLRDSAVRSDSSRVRSDTGVGGGE